MQRNRILAIGLLLVLALGSVFAVAAQGEPSTTRDNGTVAFTRPDDGTDLHVLANLTDQTLYNVQVFDERDGEFQRQNKFNGTLNPFQTKEADHNIPKGEVVKITYEDADGNPTEVIFDFGAPATGDVVVRVFLDENNDVNDANENGLEGWTVKLIGNGQRLEATTGPNGFASFVGVEKGDYRIRMIRKDDGWRLARANAETDASNPGKIFVVGGHYDITADDFVTRVNGDDEAWVRFSTIRVQRVLVTDAPNGSIFDFYRVSDNGRVRLIGSDNSGPNGFATLVAGGLRYEQDVKIVERGTGKFGMVTIPYGYQPKVSYLDFEDPGLGDVVVRVFLDANNDVNDRDESGLEGWTVQLVGNGQRLEATTGPNGFASFLGVEKTDYKVRVIRKDDGWRLARANAETDASNAKTIYVVGGSYDITADNFVTRVNGDDEAWVRFSTIRVQRITIGGANNGDQFEFYRINDNGRERLIGTDGAGPNGIATLVAGGLRYEGQVRVFNVTQGNSFIVTIPYGFQPNINWADQTCNKCAPTDGPVVATS